MSLPIMEYLIFPARWPRPAELQSPSERILASGSVEAVLAAARLLGVSWRAATLNDVAVRDIREECDAEILAHLDAAASRCNESYDSDAR